jgi:hypothetical protein
VKANYLGVDARRCGEFFFMPALNKVVSLVNAVKYFPMEFTPIKNAPIPAQPPTNQASGHGDWESCDESCHGGGPGRWLTDG